MDKIKSGLKVWTERFSLKFWPNDPYIDPGVSGPGRSTLTLPYTLDQSTKDCRTPTLNLRPFYPNRLDPQSSETTYPSPQDGLSIWRWSWRMDSVFHPMEDESSSVQCVIRALYIESTAILDWSILFEPKINFSFLRFWIWNRPILREHSQKRET